MLEGYKIAHFGNMANDAYPVVVHLRKTGVDADLYVNKDSHITGLPQWEEVKLRVEDIGDPYHPKWERLDEGFQAPDWLRYLDFANKGFVTRMRMIRREMKRYDLIVAHVPYFLYAQFVGVRYLAFEAGAIRYFPGTENFDDWKVYDRFRFWLMARSYRHAKQVLLTNPDTIRLAEKMNYDWTFMPFLIDTERYKPMKLPTSFPYEYVVFNPSRQDWATKGQNLLIGAFKRFNDECKDSHLFLVNWGGDISRSAELIRKLDLERHCSWVPLMSKPLLVEMFNKSTVIADQFLLGSSGTAGLEAMASGKPLIIHLSEEHIKQVYDEPPPHLEASSEQQILNALFELTDTSVTRKLSERSREWVVRHHGPETVIPRHLKIYAEALI